LIVKSDPLELEIPFCVMAVLPWKDIVSFKVIAVVKKVCCAANKEKDRIATK
jgi:hypothetical protein